MADLPAASVTTSLERAVRRDRAVLLGLGLSASAAFWALTVRMAGEMGCGPGAHPGLGHLFGMWAVMMAGMMIPPELPHLSRLARAQRERLGRSPLLAAGACLAGYLLPWSAFSLAAAVLEERLAAHGLLGHDLALTSRGLAAALLVAAGAVELSPLKRACLDRPGEAAPLGGARAAALAGMVHATFSLGSCGLLMLVLFATGVMNLLSMAVITALLIAEEVAPRSLRLPAAAGALLLGWGALVLAG